MLSLSSRSSVILPEAPPALKSRTTTGLRCLSISLVLAAACAGQTTGCPGLNDYTINGSVSGSTSCTKVTIPSGSAITFSVSAQPGSTVIYAFSLCPCAPGSAYIPTCGCSVNSIDLNLFCPIYTLPPMPVDGGGYSIFSLPPFCPAGMTFSTQAVVIDPTCPGGLRLTQAYDVCCL